MITEQPIKKRRGPVKGTNNFIEVDLVDLIKMFHASAKVRVARKWILEQGYAPNMNIPSLSEVLAAKVSTIPQPPAQVVTNQEATPQESNNLRLEVREIGEEDFD